MERKRNATKEAEAYVAGILADDSPSAAAYKLLGRQRHSADIKEIAAETVRRVEPYLGRALYKARHHHEHCNRRSPTSRRPSARRLLSKM